jgi:hypothetical protein
MSVIEKKTGRPRFGGLHAMSDLRQSNWNNPAIDNSSRARARPGLSISWILPVGALNNCLELNPRKAG